MTYRMVKTRTIGQSAVRQPKSAIARIRPCAGRRLVYSSVCGCYSTTERVLVTENFFGKSKRFSNRLANDCGLRYSLAPCESMGSSV